MPPPTFTPDQIYQEVVTKGIGIAHLKYLHENDLDGDINYFHVADLACQYNRLNFIKFIKNNISNEPLILGSQPPSSCLDKRAKQLLKLSENHKLVNGYLYNYYSSQIMGNPNQKIEDPII